MRKIVGPVIAGLAVMVLTMGAASSCGSGTIGASQAPTSKTQAITYTVEGGTLAGNITYSSDGAGSQEQASDVKLPWTKTINVSSGFALVSLLAQNSAGKSITCRITDADGKVIKEATSTGKYAIASCSGSVS